MGAAEPTAKKYPEFPYGFAPLLTKSTSNFATKFSFFSLVVAKENLLRIVTCSGVTDSSATVFAWCAIVYSGKSGAAGTIGAAGATGSAGNGSNLNCPLFLAAYVSDPTPYVPPAWSTWSFWQYSDTGSVPGVSGSVDLDAWNGSVSSLDKLRLP